MHKQGLPRDENHNRTKTYLQQQNPLSDKEGKRPRLWKDEDTDKTVGRPDYRIPLGSEKKGLSNTNTDESQIN